MNKELKVNDPVMWRKKEYRFVEYSNEHGYASLNWGVIQRGKYGEEEHTVHVSELDLILEFDFGG
tara:strand:+ start:200 stop:394 length:195 start_codon:yes stop_codon:yes gene_type:complete